MNQIDNIDIFKVGTSSFNAETRTQIGFEVAGDTNGIIVSSAAIYAGMLATGTEQRPSKQTEMHELQRLASIGWRHILNSWEAAVYRKTTGGLLLTKQELGPRRHERVEALRVIHTLLSHRNVPIINENDAIAHDEIAFGDNDNLAAILAARIAESPLFGNHVRLFLLTDVDSVRERADDPTTRIPVIESTDDYRHIAGEAISNNGTGGMVTKFEAADTANAAGVDVWLYNPKDGHHMRAVRGEIGTYFPAKAKRT